MEDNNRNTMDYAKVSQRAVAIAKENGEVFDYSPESISALDRLFKGQAKRYQSGNATQAYIWNLSVIFGVYLGQALLFNGLADLGYKWVTDSEDIPLLSDGGENFVSPLRHLFLYAKGQQQHTARVLFESVLKIAYGELDDAVTGSMPT